MSEDHSQTLYYLTSKIDQIQNDLTDIKVDIAVMKQADIMTVSPEQIKKSQIRDTAASGGVGGIIVAVLIGLWEFVSRKMSA
jgi:hypothetical protein